MSVERIGMKAPPEKTIQIFVPASLSVHKLTLPVVFDWEVAVIKGFNPRSDLTQIPVTPLNIP